MNILVTGAGKGLGLALVKKFSEEPGNKIIAVSRNIEKINEFIGKGQPGRMNFAEIIPYSFNLVTGDYRELKDFVSLHFDSLDILINNAGYLIRKPFLEISDEDFDTTFNTNVKAVFKIIRTMFPLCVTNTHIINITSMSGFQGSVKFPGLSAYSASKAAVAGLTESLAVELTQKGIVVNALAMGSVQTEMFAEAFPGYIAPLTAAQMADFVVDFAKNGYKFFNGKVLPVAVSTP